VKLDLHKFEFEQKHKDFIEQLNTQELEWLGEMIWDRVKLIQDLDYLAKSNMYKRGHVVGWEKDGELYKGQVVKVNRKTIIVTETKPPYKQWKIDPNFLYKI